MLTSSPIVIRAFCDDEWTTYREIRLLALKTDPGAFCSNFAREEALSDAEWQTRSRKCLGAFDGSSGRCVALGGIVPRSMARRELLTPENTQRYNSYGEIVSIWVRPEYRRKGLASLMCQKLAEFGRSSFGFAEITVSINPGNEEVLKLYRQLGYVPLLVDERDDGFILKGTN